MPINPEGGFETELERELRLSRRRYANRVYTNANKFLLDEKFHVFHCKRCTSHVLITDADFESAPRRRTDNAPVFCPDKNLVKLHTKPVPGPVKVKRLKGLETQYLHACTGCGQHVAYQSVPHNNPAGVPMVYVIETAVIFPKKYVQPRLRCKVCGFVPKNEQHFEDHKRSRGHWDQEKGSFPSEKDNADAPINPIIVG